MQSVLRAVLVSTIFLSVFACSRPQTGPVAVHMSFPTSSQFRSVGRFDAGSSIDYSLLCFVVNVTGGPVKSSQNTCDINKGLLAGSVAPGGTLSLDVPNGSGLSFEVYGLLRTDASQTCPTEVTAQWNWPIKQIYFLGKTDGVTIQPPSATVDVTITLPNATQNLAVQENLPPSCLPATAPSSSGRVQQAAGVLHGSTYILYSRLGDVSELKTITGNKYSIKNWKASAK